MGGCAVEICEYVFVLFNTFFVVVLFKYFFVVFVLFNTFFCSFCCFSNTFPVVFVVF